MIEVICKETCKVRIFDVKLKTISRVSCETGKYFACDLNDCTIHISMFTFCLCESVEVGRICQRWLAEAWPLVDEILLGYSGPSILDLSHRTVQALERNEPLPGKSPFPLSTRKDGRPLNE
jgi:hypothetical protein